MRRLSWGVLIAALLTMAAPSVAVAVPPAQRAAAAPTGFTDTTLFSLAGPSAIAWTPDGRMLVTSDAGQLRVARGGVLVAAPALDLSARSCTDGERGLVGLAVDPAFATNSFVYLYWNYNKFGSCSTGTSTAPVNRVTRHVLGSDDKVVAGSERVILDNLASPATNHNGGDLEFGADGLLYVSVGDGGCQLGQPTRCAAQNQNSRRLDILNGKVLRITRDGTIPAGNPYATAAGARRCGDPAGVPAGTGPCRETWAAGFRNPFRIARRPGTSSFYVNDVGQNTWEEIDALQVGKDYGWNVREGFCATGSTTDCGTNTFTNPLFAYGRGDGCASITGGAFVPDGLWPAPYAGSYLFGDFVCGGIYRLAPAAGGGFTREPVIPGAVSPVHLDFGPAGSTSALYYLSYSGSVHRITRTDAGTAPTAAFGHRPDGLVVALDGTASRDADAGDRVVSWRWDFGDGTTATTTRPTVSHTYPRAATYRATLTVVDSTGLVSAPTVRSVYAGEHPPSISVAWPAASARFSVGQQVSLSATATDPEDGALPASAIIWTVRLQHGTHAHPYAGPVSGASITTTYPQPEDLDATTTSYLTVQASARDARGFTTASTTRLLPATVAVSFATEPAGGRVVVSGRTLTTPATLTSWAGHALALDVPDQTIGTTAYTFSGWSDGGARAHSVRTPASATTYTARFAPAG
jgi:glucose/arabinose dehydrogenase/PKD repeat protein